MPTPIAILSCALKRAAGPGRGRLAAWVTAAVAAATLAGCSPVVSIENADIPGWRATALPPVPGALLEDAGRIINRDPIIRKASTLPAGGYTLTATCEGGGKAFFAVAVDGEAVVDAGAACNGSREITRITVPRSGTLEISTSSVDAPLIYAYQLTPS